ncbi:MAG: TonB-dependent receptor [Bacteroidaceae bacterium]
MKRFYASLMMLCMATTYAQEKNDTTLMQEVTVSNTKDNRTLREQPLASTTISTHELVSKGMHSVTDLSSYVPGLFIPAYGSRQTTAIYMRGVGSRINTPAVGLYVDDIPWIDKSAYDFDLSDVQSINILRGPQSTLYGRNAMGGLIRVSTKNPLDYQGTDINLQGATHGTARASATHYHRISSRLGFSGGFGYAHSEGFFTNRFTGRKADRDDEANARFRLVAKPTDVVRLDFHANYEYSHQGAYPYMLEKVSEEDYFYPTISEHMDQTDHNRKSQYERHLLNLGFKAEHNWQKAVMSYVAGFQYLHDCMDMDQDFTRADIYTLIQRQDSRVLSQEIALKNQPGTWKHWEWSTGISGFCQWLTTNAPVTFRQEGIDWINDNMNTMANAHMPVIQQTAPNGMPLMTMKMLFNDQIQGTELPFQGHFQTPTSSGAVYHQSTITDLLGVKGLDLTAGLRLDYEKLRLKYDTGYDFLHEYELTGELTLPSGTRNLTLVEKDNYQTRRNLMGKLNHDYLQFLPRFSLQYKIHESNIYATISRGYRSGGYNIQQFSGALQRMMQADIMQDVAQVTVPVLQEQPAVPADIKEQVTGMLNGMAAQPDINLRDLCQYKPEYAWNYEAGTHTNLLDRRLRMDVAVFLTEVRDQQVSRMADNGLGRITVNAGRSRAVGCEISADGQITEALSAHTAYGFTHSTFRTYSPQTGISYRGNYVSFVPLHTFNAGARYTWNLSSWLQHITLQADWNGRGKTYWTEDNQVSEPFYGTLDARLSFTHEQVELSLWGKNLTNQDYRAFYFESMGRGFHQKGAPLQAGVDIRIRL